MLKAPNKCGDPQAESPRASTSAAEEAPAGDQNPEVVCPDMTGQFCTDPNPPSPMRAPAAPDSPAGHPENSLGFQVGHSACLEGVGSEFHGQDGPWGWVY